MDLQSMAYHNVLSCAGGGGDMTIDRCMSPQFLS